MKFEVKLKPGESEERLYKIAAQKVPGCRYVRILKKSLDARNKADIRWLYSVEAERSAPPKKEKKIPQVARQPRRIVVVGSGPAGLFCALRLLRGGIQCQLLALPHGPGVGPNDLLQLHGFLPLDNISD